MRKILSFLTAILFAGSMMAAEELKATLAFDGTVEWGIPTSGTNTASASFTADGYTIQLASTTNYKQNSGYLILGKAYSTLTLPAFTWKTTKIVVTGRSGASASVKQNIYVGENAVSTETTGATGVNEYVIAADYQAAGNVYVLNVTSGHNTQIVKIEIYGETASQGGEEPVAVETKTIYCSPFSEWHNDGARFAVYALGDGENTAWYDLVAVEGAENVYSAEIAEAFPTVIFCRMNGATTENNWDNKWNQTADLTLPTDGKNLYTITGWNANDGAWSVYGDTPEPPVDPEPADPVFGISGEWDNFTANTPFTISEDGLTGTFAIDLEAGEYEFKIRKDDAWLTKANEGNAYGLHREWVGVAGVTNDATENLKLTADVNGVYTFTWTFANDSIGIVFPAVHQLNEIWKVVEETAVAAETEYINNYALEVNSTYAGTLKTNARAFEGYKFTHAIQVRTDGYPSAEKLIGTEKDGSTSLVITAKENVEVAFFYNRQTTSNETGAAALNDNKDMKIFDQAAITTPLDGEFKVVWMQEDKKYVNAIKIVTLEKDHIYTVTASGTTIQLHGIRYISDAVAPEPPAEAPSAAPEAPTYEGYQVKAVYSATYNADCSFGEWSSGTQYAQEEFGKKYVTNNTGYFGLEFTGKDCSEMEALHLDIWAASDISLRVVPIHGGTEVGVTVQAQGQQWNAIDIPLADFEGVTNWSNVYQIKIDNASNLTFWLNNVYFYTTQTKTIDLTDGYYLLGNMNGWDIHNLTAAHLFAVNPDNDAEYKLTYTLADGDNFKVVAVANNELGAWYPAEGDNYVVDFAHAGERDIYFRPDYQGGEDWHAGCIYVAAEENANPWETWFASGDTWNTETESYLEWDGENQKATIHINVDKNGQWRAQAKYHGPVAEEGKCYRVALKLKSNNAISNVTIKYQDNVEMVYVSDAALEANVEYVFDQTAAGLPNGNGILVLDFGFAKAGDIIEIYDVVIEEAECPQIEHTYTVAGGSAELFGAAWDSANEANDMVKQEDGTYKWEKAELTLAAGTVQFKVCEDHAWDVAYPASDYQLAIPEAGIYTITITFNADSKEVNAVATKTGSAVVIPTIAMHGNFLGSWADTENFTVAEGDATASLTLTLEAGNYEFGMRIGGSGNWTANGAAFTRENAAHVIEAGSGNLTLAADEAGEYTFTWTFATNSLAIEFPEGGEPATGCDWDNIDFLGDGSAEQTYSNQFKVCKVGEQPNVVNIQTPDFAAETGIYVNFPSAVFGEISLAEGQYVISGAGMVLYCSAFTQEYTEVTVNWDGNDIVFTVYNAKAVTPVPVANYYVIGSMTGWEVSEDHILTPNNAAEGQEFMGEFTFAANDEFKVVLNDKVAWFPEGENNNFVITEAGDYTVYFRPNGDGGEGWHHGYIYAAKKEATAISNTAADVQAVKVLNNGMLLIRKGDKTYNVMGQAVK